MATLYADFSTGNDSTGTGTSGNPYKTVTKVISVANGGDTIMLSNVAAFVLTTAIVWTGFGATTAASTANPLIIKAWNNGGSIAVSLPTGNVTGAEINCNVAAASAFATGSMPSDVFLEGIILHGSTGVLLTPASDWNFYHCEFYASKSTSTVNCSSSANNFIECIIRDPAVSNCDGIRHNGGFISGCYFKGITGNSLVCQTSGAAFVTNNVIKCGANKNAISITGGRHVIVNNTLVGDGTASQVGITCGAASYQTTIISNIITDVSGTSAKAFDTTAGGNQYMFGYTSYRNNTTNINASAIKGVDLTANDITETSTPYTNAAGADYSLVVGALSRQAGVPRGVAGSSTLNYPDIGGAQAVASAGGGGTTGRAYAC